MTHEERLAKKAQHDRVVARMKITDRKFATAYFSDSIAEIRYILRALLQRPDLQISESLTRLRTRLSFEGDIEPDVVTFSKDESKMYFLTFLEDDMDEETRDYLKTTCSKRGADEHGDKIKADADSYLLLIGKEDFSGAGVPVCFANQVVFPEERQSIIYICTSCRGNGETGDVIHDLTCADTTQMRCDALRERMKFIKETPVGECLLIQAVQAVDRDQNPQPDKQF